MFQLIFIGPLIYFLIKKYDFFGTVICFVITAMWELIQFCWGTDGYTYSHLIFRYISIIAFGMFIALGKRKLNNRILILMFVVGVTWQTLLNYLPMHPYFMNYDWARVNYISSLFVMPIMYALIKKFGDYELSFYCLQELGKASFNIYLVQMAFYSCGGSMEIYRFIHNDLLQLVMCLFICSVVGYIYFKIENKITNRIINRLKINDYYLDAFKNFVNNFNEIMTK